MNVPTDRCVGCALAVGLAACVDAAAERAILRQNEALFHAIAARDVATLEQLTTPDFHFRTAEGQAGDRRAWLDGVAAIPATIESIINEDLRLKLDGDRAVLCGVQRAVVLHEGQRLVDQ